VQFGAKCDSLQEHAESSASWLFIKWNERHRQSAQFASTSYYMPVRKTAGRLAGPQGLLGQVPQGKQGFDLIQYSSPEPNIADSRTSAM